MRGLTTKVVFILFVLVGSIPACAQKYKDIYPTIATATDEDALPILNRFLIQELDHPNTNFKLAMLYDRRYKEADVLTENEKALANANRAMLRLIKARQLVDEREVKKNMGYYAEFSSGMDSKGRPIVSFATLSNAMITKVDSITLFLEKTPAIYQSFVNAVISYDKAIKLFAAINQNNNSLDNLFMTYSDELATQLTDLKQAYDSTIIYLDEYKSLIAAYPISNHNQDYTIKTIENYRLSGLITQSDFLTDNIEIWNYGQWVDDVTKVMKTDIAGMRANAVTYEKALDASLEKAGNPAYYSIFEPVKRDKELLFNLKKFDSRSVLVGLFQYKDFLQGLKHKTHGDAYYDTATAVTVQTKRTYYGEVINGCYKADSMLMSVEGRLSAESIRKHKAFIDKFYQGDNGLETFVKTENKWIEGQYEKYVLSMRNSIVSEVLKEEEEGLQEVKYKRMLIPLTLNDTVSIDSLLHGHMLTTQVLMNADGSRYVSGSYRSKSKLSNTVSYALRLNPENRVSWYKEFDIAVDSLGSDANNWVTALALTPEGCAMVVRSKHLQNHATVNTLVYINEAGEEKLKQRLEVSDYPRTMTYAASTNSFVMSFKGSIEVQDVLKNETLTMVNVNVLGDQLWSHHQEFAGSVEYVDNTNTGLIMIGNFTAKKNAEGLEVRTKVANNETHAYVELFNKKGQSINTMLINSPASFAITHVEKVNDSNINLFGFKGEYNQVSSKPLNYGNSVVHIITNTKLNTIYNSMTNK